jgi:hypothetical protein
MQNKKKISMQNKNKKDFYAKLHKIGGGEIS